MSETTILRTSAIVRNATFAPPQHGPVKTGELPLVQVRMAPGGPQVQNGQQKEVEILPPRDAASALAIGGLPMVQVRMTQNGPQLDDGRDQTVLIKDTRRSSVTSGNLPMVEVKMTTAGPQLQTLSTVQGGPPQIPAALPALSAARGATPARQVVATPVRQVVAAAPRQVMLPPVPELPTDQLMLCRHLVEKYLGDLRADNLPVADEGAAENSVGTENIKLAERTIFTLDEALVATAVRAAAAATAASTEVEVETVAAPAPPVAAVATTTAYAAATIAPAPSTSYVAGRVGTRSFAGAGPRAPRNSQLAPRRVVRSGAPLPPVIVKMEGRQAVVVNKAEIDQVRAAVLNQAEADQAPIALTVSEVVAESSEAPAQG